jgi:hypothetical protein
MEVGREPLASSNGDGDVEGTPSRKRALVGQVADLLMQNVDLIERRQPRTLVNQCGYQLGDVLRDGQVDLGRLLTGSEGRSKTPWRPCKKFCRIHLVRATSWIVVT